MFNDKDIINDCLKDQKYITSSYNSYSNEASNSSLRRDLQNILMEEHQIHERMFETMSQKGFYQPQPANPQRISQARSQFGNGMTTPGMTMGTTMGTTRGTTMGTAMGQMGQYGQTGQSTYQSPSTMTMGSTQGSFNSPFGQTSSFQGTSGQGLFSGGMSSSASRSLQQNFQNIRSQAMSDFSETTPDFYSEVQGTSNSRVPSANQSQSLANNQNRYQTQGTSTSMNGMNNMNMSNMNNLNNMNLSNMNNMNNMNLSNMNNMNNMNMSNMNNNMSLGSTGSQALNNLQNNFQNIKSSAMSSFEETRPDFHQEVQGTTQSRVPQNQQ